MGNSPKEQDQAIINNLPAKTGKKLTDGIALLNKSGLNTRKERFEFLKAKHQLGHFQATIILKLTAAKGDGDYDKPDQLIDKLFGDENQPLRDVYLTLSEFLNGPGKDIQCKPRKTYIPFYRRKQFLIVKPQKGILYLGLPALSEKSGSDFTPAKGLGFPEKIQLAIPQTSGRELTNDVQPCIREAYNEN